jgi:hypothetical protein
VAVVDGIITAEAPVDAMDIDATGSFLLPGFIDSHVHVDSEAQLAQGAQWGVTTMLDMGSAHWDHIKSLRDAQKDARADIRGVAEPASVIKGTPTKKMGFPLSSAVRIPGDASRWLAERLSKDSDYIKIVLEERLPFKPKPLSPETVAAIVIEAHKAGKKVIRAHRFKPVVPHRAGCGCRRPHPCSDRRHRRTASRATDHAFRHPRVTDIDHDEDASLHLVVPNKAEGAQLRQNNRVHARPS